MRAIVLDASLTHFHLDFPRKAVRSLGWCEDVQVELGKLAAAKGRPLGKLVIYNGSGMILAMGGLDYLMEVVRTPDRCYTLLI